MTVGNVKTMRIISGQERQKPWMNSSASLPLGESFETQIRQVLKGTVMSIKQSIRFGHGYLDKVVLIMALSPSLLHLLRSLLFLEFYP